jgi:methyltransferase (TIGR00027 family)
MASSPVLNVADTAFWIAHYRGEESDRPDALFRDPLARTLAGERGRKIAQGMPGRNMTRWLAVVRTCVIDDYIRTLTGSGLVDTVLNLGAGLDTRPYRMDLPASLRWVEVDQSEMIEFKERELKGQRPRCSLERHAVNLAEGEARRALLARVCGEGRRVLVLTEGVIPYLSNADVGALADELRAQPGVVAWIAEYFSPQVMKFRAKRMSRVTANAPFLFDPPEWFPFFKGHGWKPKEVRYLHVEGERRGRPFPAPFIMRVAIALTRLRAGRRSENGFSQSMGYVLFEPSSSAT